jgi:hypothetical protein
MNETRASRAKHTSGPWYTRHGQISSETSAHGCTIANCNATAKGISQAEVDANARLIAAAPEMFEALKRLTAWHGNPGSLADLDGARETARAALAKAEG